MGICAWRRLFPCSCPARPVFVPRSRGEEGTPTSPLGIFCALLSEVACALAAHAASSREGDRAEREWAANG